MPHRAWNPSGATAWLITFTTYGSRLPGDTRGSVDRQARNAPGDPLRAGNREIEQSCRARMVAPAFFLDGPARRVLQEAIQEFCVRVDWQLHALAVRSNHVHPLVTSPWSGAQTKSALKRAASIELRRAGLIRADARTWTRQGSTRPLWTEQEVVRAKYYVEYMKDNPDATMPWAVW